MIANPEIIGRYAPSPTGDLHLGNARTALLAWLHARVQGGEFLMRMEDIDLPRVVAGSAEQILRDLRWLGLDWDGEIEYQSARNDLYQTALSTLEAKGLVYPCFCSRKDIRQAASAPHAENAGAGTVYTGTCASLSELQITEKEQHKTPAMRIRVAGSLVDSCGDFVIKRADKLFAYQLAVVVDDLEQGITDVVRGADLLDSTERQRYLAKQLEPDAPAMKYYHAPLMLDAQGERMSKRYGSRSIADCRTEGLTAEQLIGELAVGLALIDENRPLSVHELLAETKLSDLDKLMTVTG